MWTAASLLNSDLLERGSYGTVRKIHNEDVVVKEMYSVERSGFKRTALSRFDSEVDILRALADAPYIVRMLGSFALDTSLYIAMEYCPGADLYYQSLDLGMPRARVRFYAAEASIALNYMHVRGIMYRDIKPENMMVGADGHLRLVDFGLARRGVKRLCGACTTAGTPGFLAPEVVRHLEYGYSADWWSLGATIYVMMHSTALPERGEDMLVHADPSVGSLIGGLLRESPCRRFGFKQVENHPFFGGVRYFSPGGVTPP
jgi:serine/threonine protein kinase